MGLTRLCQGFLLIVLALGCSDGVEQGEAGQEDPVVQGRKLFITTGCNVCHGNEGRGDGPVARNLKPKPRDFADLAGYKRGPGLTQIEETIEKGLNSSGGIMPAFPNLKPEDRRLLALFVQSLQPK